MINKNISNWISDQKKRQFLTVEKKDLFKLIKWIYNKREMDNMKW